LEVLSQLSDVSSMLLANTETVLCEHCGSSYGRPLDSAVHECLLAAASTLVEEYEKLFDPMLAEQD